MLCREGRRHSLSEKRIGVFKGSHRGQEKSSLRLDKKTSLSEEKTSSPREETSNYQRGLCERRRGALSSELSMERRAL